MLLETVANLCASRRQANDFFRSLFFFIFFELESITTHLMTDPAGNSEFCPPSTSKFRSLLPLELVIKSLMKDERGTYISAKYRFMVNGLNPGVSVVRTV